MVRIAGVRLPRNKRVDIGLTHIFGIGKVKADQIAEAANVSPDKKCKDLTDQDVLEIRKIISSSYQVEGDLRRKVSQNIKRLKDIGSAAGRRHRVGLPVRGQRTKTNAKTRKKHLKSNSKI
jgi:small subunit ribosomal protein S13